MRLLLVVALVVAGVAGVVVAPTPRSKGGLKPQLQKLVDRLADIKAPAPITHEKLTHAKLTKPSEADKHVPAEQRLTKLLDALKVVQGQQMVLGSALHTIMEKLNQENEQIDDQQSVLASSFKGLIENVATRQDMEEIQTAAGEDNELHLELEDTTKKVHSLVKHMSAAQGHPEEDFEEKWNHLRKVISDSSLDQELEHAKDIVRTLTGHTEAASSSLWFFILLNAAFLLGLLLWRSKGGYSFPR